MESVQNPNVRVLIFGEYLKLRTWFINHRAIPAQTKELHMTTEDRIVRAAQRFLDSITFSLKEHSVNGIVEEVKKSVPEPIESKTLIQFTSRLIVFVESLKKRRIGWNIGEILLGQDLEKFTGKRLIFSNQKVQ